MSEHFSDQWSITLLRSGFPWSNEPIRPADISRKLREVMLSKKNLLEDAHYRKVVPNRYVVELGQDNYARNYQPIQKRIIEQWREKLLEDLETANSRQGRREYSFAGRVEIDIRPAADLSSHQARIYSQFAAAPASSKAIQACLQAANEDRTWKLHQGNISIGRDPTSEIYLDMPSVQAKRLVSGQHAHLRCNENGCWIFDGIPNGRPSVNGTYVNYRPVPADGQLLQDGDLIILASLSPNDPRPDTPGVAALYFRSPC